MPELRGKRVRAWKSATVGKWKRQHLLTLCDLYHVGVRLYGLGAFMGTSKNLGTPVIGKIALS